MKPWSNWRRIHTMCVLGAIFLITQFDLMRNYDKHVYDSNPIMFAQHFDLIPFYRTNLHSKGLKHWYEWIELNGKYFSSFGSSLTLLHLDTHAHNDIISDEIYECSPGQFFQYDTMVTEILQLTEDLIDNFIDFSATDRINITHQMIKIGYFPTVVWVYPDHWLNFSTTIAYDVHYHLYRQYAAHQTYYITPLNGLRHEYSMLKSTQDPSDQHHFWSNILFKNSIQMVDRELNSSQSLQIDIIAIPLSALLTEPHLNGNNTELHLILDIDLDLFACQSVAENMMERFEWSHDLMQQLNTILNHHQYLPNHIPNDLYQEALLTLIHMIAKNDKIPMNNATNHTDAISIPRIVDIVQLFAQNMSTLHVDDLQHILLFLYRFQLELGEAFMEPLQLFLSTHSYLDQLLNNTRHSQRRQWHRNLAKILNMEMQVEKLDQSFVSSSSSLGFDATIINQTNNNYFEAHLLPHLQEIKTHGQMEAQHRDEEVDDVIQIGILLHEALEFTEHRHKISQHLIEQHLNQTDKINIQNLTHLITNQTDKIWNPDHDWFYDQISAKSDANLSYPQILQMLGIDPSYKYGEWQSIEPTQPKPFNATKLTLTARDIDEVINWDKLDKMQQDFVQNGDHRAMHRFVTDLNAKQKMFLQWLLFCFYHPQNCEDGHNPFELVPAADAVFGERFAWNELIRIPSFVESVSAKNRGLLQLEFVSLGATQKWLPTVPSERNHFPKKKTNKTIARCNY
eukprot:682374_1